MNTELFTKEGKLKKYAPKKYECKNCSNITSKPNTVKLTGVSFYVCDNCGGTIKERSIHIEWNKRKSGQWEIEEAILNTLGESKMSKGEIEKVVLSKDKNLFDSSFADLCYWGRLQIHVDTDSLRYTKSQRN